MAKTKHSQYIEMGTNKNEVDFEWIPREVIKQCNKIFIKFYAIFYFQIRIIELM